jgi:hypothetical protein
MDRLLETLMNGTRTVFQKPELATGLLLAALMVVAVRSREETEE